MTDWLSKLIDAYKKKKTTYLNGWPKVRKTLIQKAPPTTTNPLYNYGP